MNVFLINGPPRVGKDTVGNILREQHQASVWKFAIPLKERTHALYGLVDLEGLPLPHDHFEDRKDEPLEEFMGLSPRQAYIEVSERHFKRLHGADVFGRLAEPELRMLEGSVGAVAMTDSGFLEESIYVAERWPCALFRIHPTWESVRELRGANRPATFSVPFEGDSRGYLVNLPGVEEFDIINNGSLKSLAHIVSEMYQTASSLLSVRQ